MREPGVLESFNLSAEDAEALIMRARVIMGWVEAPPEPEIEPEAEDLDYAEDEAAEDEAAEGEAVEGEAAEDHAVGQQAAGEDA